MLREGRVDIAGGETVVAVVVVVVVGGGGIRKDNGTSGITSRF